MRLTNVVQKIKTHTLCSVNFPKAVYEIMWKKLRYSRTGHRWQCNTVHALCTMGNQGYRFTLRICNKH